MKEIFSKKGLDFISSRVRRWVIGLQDFNFVVEHLPGVDNVTADCLSHLVCDIEEEQFVEDVMEDEVSVCEVTSGVIQEDEWKEEVQKDSELIKVMNMIKSEASFDNSLSKVWRIIADKLSVDNEILLRGSTLVPPSSLKKRLMEEAHQGHLGILKTKERLRASFWWPGMDLEIEREVRECMQCKISDKILTPRTVPMVCCRLPNGPWEDIAIDIVGPLNGEYRTPYLIVLIDLYSRLFEVSCVSDVTSTCVISFLQDIFKREGFPKSLLSDNGPQFCSGQMSDFLLSCGIMHKKCAVYHPETNGAVERFNR